MGDPTPCQPHAIWSCQCCCPKDGSPRGAGISQATTSRIRAALGKATALHSPSVGLRALRRKLAGSGQGLSPLHSPGSRCASLRRPAGGRTKNRFLYGNSKEFGGRRRGCNKAVANEALVRCLPELRELINRQMRAKLSSEPLYQYSHYRGSFQQFQRINNKCYIITAGLLLSSLPVFCQCLLNPVQPTAGSPPAPAPPRAAQPWHHRWVPLPSSSRAGHSAKGGEGKLKS